MSKPRQTLLIQGQNQDRGDASVGSGGSGGVGTGSEASAVGGETFAIFASNVTFAGKRVLKFMEEERQRFAAFAFTEMHLKGDSVGSFASKCQTLGLDPFVAQAQLSAAGGCKGGAGCFVDSSFGTAAVPYGSDLMTGKQLDLATTDLAAVVIQNGVFSFVLASIYLRPSIGLAGENLARLSDLVAILGTVRLPWLVVGDWNVPPGDMQHSGWVSFMGGRVVVPDGVAITCTSGPCGGLLDYGVASGDMWHLIRGCRAETEVPWKPHCGLIFDLDGRTPTVWCRSLVLPRTRRFESVKRNEVCTRPSCEEEALNDRWKRARIMAAAAPKKLWYRENHECKRSVAYMATAAASARLGKMYASWITAAELFHQQGLEGPKDLYVGRARGPEFRLSQVSKEVLFGKTIAGNVACPQQRWWCVLVFQLQLLLTLGAPSTPGAVTQRAQVAKVVARLVASPPDFAAAIFEDIPRFADWKGWLGDVLLHGPDLLAEWLEHARTAEKRTSAIAIEAARKSFLAWVDEQAGGKLHCSGIYGFVRGPSPITPAAFEGRWHPGLVTEPLDKAEHKRLTWSEWWCARPHGIQLLLKRLPDLVELARSENLPAPTLAEVDDALFTFKDSTGQNVDGVGPLFIKTLPREGRQDFANLIGACQTLFAWPWQAYCVLGALLPKADGGERVIGLLPMVCRVGIRVHRGRTRKWCAERARFWDFAVAESSALRSAIITQLRIDLADSEGIPWAVILYDLAKFYDTICLSALVVETMRFRYSPTVSVLALLTYMAPRVLKVGRAAMCCFSDFIHPSTSIVAGCGEAVNQAKLALYNVLDKMHEWFGPENLFSLYVDDSKQFCEGNDEVEVIMSMAKAGSSFVRSCQGMGLRLSKKSTIVAASSRIARCLKRALGPVVNLNVAARAVDLGVDVAFGKRRATPKAAARVKIAGLKNSRIGLLQRKQIRARVFRAAALAQATWGVEARGCPPTQLHKLRRTMAAHLGYKPGMCTTSLLQLETSDGDPSISVPLRTVDMYLSIWKSIGNLRDRTRAVWRTKLADITRVGSKLMWSGATGYISPMICTLISAGWKPNQADQWEDPAGVTWQMTDDVVDTRIFRKQFANTQLLRLWEQAARGHLGKGLEGGGDVTVARRLVKKLRLAGDAKTAQLAVTIVAGGLWPRSRCKEAGYLVEDAMCPLCGEEPDCEFHRAYECRIICEADNEVIKNTNNLARWAKRHWTQLPCLWLRGIIPLDMLATARPSSSRVFRSYGCFSHLGENDVFDCSAFTWYVDESGGAHSAEPLLRRCGWGIAALRNGLVPTDDLQFAGGFASSLPGDEQSPNRACVDALAWILGASFGDLCIKPDSAYVVDGVNLRARLIKAEGSHADLWAQAGAAASRRHGNVTVVKTQAHLEDAELLEAPWPVVVDYAGNAFADALAAAGAQFQEADINDVLTVSFARGRAYNILNRLVEANRIFLDAVGECGAERPRLAVMPKPTLFERLCRDSEHDLGGSWKSMRVGPATYRCSRCAGGGSKKTIKAFLKVKCAGHLKMLDWSGHGAEFRGQKADIAPVRVGRSDLHSSHVLAFMRGFWWCTSCGSYTTCSSDAKASPKVLRRPCKKFAARAGIGYLRRFARGMTPRAGMSWPNVDSGLMPPLVADRVKAAPLRLRRRRLRAKTDPRSLPFGGDEFPRPTSGAGNAAGIGLELQGNVAAAGSSSSVVNLADADWPVLTDHEEEDPFGHSNLGFDD